MLEINILLLLFVANGAPILARRLFGNKLALPLDGGAVFVDGRRLFGRSKTLRGLLIACLASGAVAPLFGLTVLQGLLFGFLSLLGDLLSSFVKRRLGKEPSSMALGLDQIPESLLPLLVFKTTLALSWSNIGVIVVLFFLCELVLSKILYKLQIRNRPY